MYEALISFSGIISMKKGDIKPIEDKMIIDDLLQAGYIKEVETNNSNNEKDNNNDNEKDNNKNKDKDKNKDKNKDK